MWCNLIRTVHTENSTGQKLILKYHLDGYEKSDTCGIRIAKYQNSPDGSIVMESASAPCSVLRGLCAKMIANKLADYAVTPLALRDILEDLAAADSA